MYICVHLPHWLSTMQRPSQQHAEFHTKCWQKSEGSYSVDLICHLRIMLAYHSVRMINYRVQL